MQQPEYQRQSEPPKDGRDTGRGRPKHRGRFMRFMRGYLMIVGGATTVYVLVRLLILLFVEIGAWLPATPTM